MNMAIWCQDINMLLKVWALLLTFGPSFSTERNCFCLNTEEPCVVRSHHVVWQNTKIDWRNGVCSCFFSNYDQTSKQSFLRFGHPKSRICPCRNHPQFGDPWVTLGCRVLRKHQLGIGSKTLNQRKCALQPTSSPAICEPSSEVFIY